MNKLKENKDTLYWKLRWNEKWSHLSCFIIRALKNTSLMPLENSFIVEIDTVAASSKGYLRKHPKVGRRKSSSNFRIHNTNEIRYLVWTSRSHVMHSIKTIGIQVSSISQCVKYQLTDTKYHVIHMPEVSTNFAKYHVILSNIWFVLMKGRTFTIYFLKEV